MSQRDDDLALLRAVLDRVLVAESERSAEIRAAFERLVAGTAP